MCILRLLRDFTRVFYTLLNPSDCKRLRRQFQTDYCIVPSILIALGGPTGLAAPLKFACQTLMAWSSCVDTQAASARAHGPLSRDQQTRHRLRPCPVCHLSGHEPWRAAGGQLPNSWKLCQYRQVIPTPCGRICRIGYLAKEPEYLPGIPERMSRTAPVNRSGTRSCLRVQGQ